MLKRTKANLFHKTGLLRLATASIKVVMIGHGRATSKQRGRTPERRIKTPRKRENDTKKKPKPIKELLQTVRSKVLFKKHSTVYIFPTISYSHQLLDPASDQKKKRREEKSRRKLYNLAFEATRSKVAETSRSPCDLHLMKQGLRLRGRGMILAHLRELLDSHP